MLVHFSTASTSVSPTASNLQRMLKTCATRCFLPSKLATGYLQKEEEMPHSRFFSQRIVSHASQKFFSSHRAHRALLSRRHCQSKSCPQIPRKCWSSNRGRREWCSRARSSQEELLRCTLYSLRLVPNLANRSSRFRRSFSWI